MKLTDFLYQKQQSVVTVTFNRPEKLNAFREQSRRELLQILDDFAEDADARVLVITGAGRAFCAGADLQELDRSKSEQFQETKERKALEQFQEITRKIISIEKPFIAAINGVAVGVGIEIALACDIRLASAQARFAFTEVKQSLFQTNGIMYLLPRLIGFGRAMEILMTGRMLTAEEALSIGLVSQVYTPQQFGEKVEETAIRLQENAPVSLKLIKRVGWKALDTSLEEVMKMEIEGMLECLQTEDIWEGTQAFLEKRKPVYQGK